VIAVIRNDNRPVVMRTATAYRHNGGLQMKKPRSAWHTGFYSVSFDTTEYYYRLFKLTVKLI